MEYCGGGSMQDIYHSKLFMCLCSLVVLYICYHLGSRSILEFEAVMVLPEITRNYGNYYYGNHVGNAHLSVRQLP